MMVFYFLKMCNLGFSLHYSFRNRFSVHQVSQLLVTRRISGIEYRVRKLKPISHVT